MTRFVIGLGALLSLPGCYCSHELPPLRDAGPDAYVRDAYFGDAAVPDAPPTCRVRCEPAERIADVTLDSQYYEWTPLVSALVTADALWVLALTNPAEASTELELVPTIVRVDLTTREAVLYPPPASLRSHAPLQGADMRLDLDELRVVLLQTSLNTFRPRDAAVGRGAWSTMTRTVVREEDRIAEAPFLLTPTSASEATVFGRDGRDLAAFADGSVVHAFILDAASPVPTLIDLVALSDAGALMPLSGAILDDGTIVLAGGGTPTRGDTARAPFVALGALEDAPLIARPILGERYDAPPLVVGESPGFALIRHVSETSDLAASAIHVFHDDPEGSVASEVRIPTRSGLRPVVMTALASSTRAGLAWTEHTADSELAVELRVVPPVLDDDCDTLGAEPVARFTFPVISMTAVAGPDGSSYVIVASYPGAAGVVPLGVYRIDGCTVER